MIERNYISLELIHTDLGLIKSLVYDKCGFNLEKVKMNFESSEYGACSYELNGHTIEHRVSKITPLKNGQFVAIWRRSKDGLTEPFDFSDELDFMVITSKSRNNFGQFIFPKYVLAQRGVISSKGNAGKRGIRVYPPWDIVTSKQAEKTQRWQLKYFLPINVDHSTNLEFAKELFSDIIGSNTQLNKFAE